MTEQFVDRPVADVCFELCSTLNDDAYLVNPSAAVIDALGDIGVNRSAMFSSLRMLAEERTLKNSLTQFTTASRLADLIERDLLTLRYLSDPPKTSMAVDEDRVVVVIDAAERVGALTTTDTEFVTAVHGTITDQFEEAERYTLHTPAISRVESTLADRLGSDRRDAFISFVDVADGTIDEVDEVTISLLVAAQHNDLLYEISKWGEDIGLASKATFSRKKTLLEEVGVIDTDSVPIDVGRPRLRLKFTQPYMERAQPAEVIEEVSSRLA